MNSIFSNSFPLRALTVWLAVASCNVATADEVTKPTPNLLDHGRHLYRTMCADCHGAEGEGVAGAYEQSLVGDDSIGQLAVHIEKTMPEGEPEACAGEDAKAVASFIHHQFYSEAAQIRRQPPRVRLSRLTANQLRQSIADIYGHFAGQNKIEDDRGLSARYFEPKGRKPKFERVDAVVDFDWGHDGPGEGIDGKAFKVQWDGGILANETGIYEIVVRSTCSFKANLGHGDRILINNHVQSGDRTEFRESVLLTAGRVYQFEIDLEQRKRKTEQPPASISLSWVPPNAAEELIPTRFLIPGNVRPTFTPQAKLPPDDNSYGFDRGIRVDSQWDASTTAVALEFAQIVNTELWPDYLRRNRGNKATDREKMREFLLELATVAFRGPVDDASKTFYVENQLAATEDDSEAIKRSIVLILKSPRFLYPALDVDRSPSQRAANRLALTLWDSLPADPWLMEAVKRDQLEKPEQIRNVARRMMDDFRARGKVQQMLYKWLNLSEHHEMSKDPELYPDFDEHVVADLKDSLDRFLEEVVWGNQSDYRQFFLADWVYTSPKLREFYGESWEPQKSFHDSGKLTKSVSDNQARFGVLSHPYLLSRLSYRDATSPIHRGVFLIRNLYGRTLKPPMESFAPLSPDLHPEMTTRQRVELQTQGASCQVCHVKINGLGFALENFDAVGRFRDKEQKKPINPVGQYVSRDGETVLLKGADSLAKHLANAEDAHRSFINRNFQFLVKQPVAAFGTDQLEQLMKNFQQREFNVRELIIDIAVIAASEPTHLSEES